MSPEPLTLVLHLLRTGLQPSCVLGDVPTSTVLLDALQLAAQQGVDGALGLGLKRHSDPGSGWRALEPFLSRAGIRNRAYNVTLISHLESIGRAYEAAGLQGIALKGAAFLLSDPDAATWRQLGDLDLLLRPDRVAEAAEALRSLGYEFAKDPSTYRSDLHHHYAPLCHADDDVTVELHTRLMQNPKADFLPSRDIFKAARRLDPLGASIMVPSPEHRFCHLVAHAQISNWGFALGQVRLKDVLDAAKLANQYAIDWSAVNEIFSAAGIRAELMSFLAAAQDLLGPLNGLPTNADRQARAWAVDARRALLEPPRGWRLAARILRRYAILFARQPRRIGLIWTILADPERRQNLLKLTRERLALPKKN